MTSGTTQTSLSSQFVYVTRDIAQEAVAILREKFEVKVWNTQDPVPRDYLLKDVRGAAGIICTISDNIDQEVMDAAGPSLKIIASMTADAVHIDTTACMARSIVVHTVADLLNDVTAEMTCCLLVVVARRLIEGQKAVLRGEWGLWKPMWICGEEFHKRTLGILGYGRIGSAVAKRMVNFGISSVIYCDVADQPMASEVGAVRVDINEVFRSADFIICSMPLTSTTKGIVDSKKLALCKPECVLVNTARGGLVNHDDLYEALRNKKIMGAGLDVCDPEPIPCSHPLLQLPNCVVTPHMSTATGRCRTNMALSVARAVIGKLS